jgi:hypothetical protein
VDSDRWIWSDRSASMMPLWKRPGGIASFAAFAVLLCSGFNSPTGCDQQNTSPMKPNGAELGVALAAVGGTVAAVTLIEMQHNKHTIKGCVISTDTGLELRTSGLNTYRLDGELISIRVGDKVKLHGSKLKKAKGSDGDQVFKVEALKKHYGPC